MLPFLRDDGEFYWKIITDNLDLSRRSAVLLLFLSLLNVCNFSSSLRLFACETGIYSIIEENQEKPACGARFCLLLFSFFLVIVSDLFLPSG